MTPRKARQRQSKPNNQIAGPSDHESDAPYHQPTTRTNEELNLSVLQRYNPSIIAVLSIAPSATIYTFEEAWERSGIEGTLFVCQSAPKSSTGGEEYCIVILNRRALENLIMDVRDMKHVEILDDYLILRVLGKENGKDEGAKDREKTLGVFLHADKEETRRVNNLMVQECWEKVRQRGASELAEVGAVGDEPSDHSHGLHYAVDQQHDHPGFGKRVSITDLFGR